MISRIGLCTTVSGALVGLLASPDGVRLSLMTRGAPPADDGLFSLVDEVTDALGESLEVLDPPSLITFFSKLMQDGGGFSRSPAGGLPNEVSKREEGSAVAFLTGGSV